MLPPSHRPGPDPRACTLPQDALYEILVRIPAKDLCRLRAVCRPWRSLLTDPHFIAVHAAYHPEPLIVVGYEARYYGRMLCDIMDLSGRVVKRVLAGSEYEWVMMRAQLDLLCVVTDSTLACQLLDPATGAVHILPEGLAAEHAAYGLGILDYSATTAFGLVASTGEYKVLRVLDADAHEHPRQLYEVFTLDHGNNDQACWRAKQAPPYRCSVELHYTCSVVMDGIVYFLLSDNGWDHSSTAYQPDLVAASFNLETEEWGAIIRGPLLSSPADVDVDVSTLYKSWPYLSMAILSGSVVLGHSTPSFRKVSPSIDLWFLMDIENGLWVKQHSIQISNLYGCRLMVQPLLVLNDGRIILHHVPNIGTSSFLKIYDPGSKTCMDVVNMDHHSAVGLYRGNLMSLPN
ncbi:unnamed protein product [Urochloa humidicola]